MTKQVNAMDVAGHKKRIFRPMLGAACLWLFAGAISLALQKYVVELYGQDFAPYSIRVWWILIPWSILAVLIVDSILRFRTFLTASGLRAKRFPYFILCFLAGLYLLLCFLPLNVTIGVN